MCLLFSMGSSVYTTAQAVKPNRLGSVDPTLRACRVSPCRQQPCQDGKIFCRPANQIPCQVCRVSPHGKTRAKLKRSFAWGQLYPPSLPVTAQCVRGQENTMPTRPVTMREHYIKTLIQSPELTMPLMEIDSRTIIYNDYNRLDTIYSPVCHNSHNYRRSLSNGHRYTNHNITICYCCCHLL